MLGDYKQTCSYLHKNYVYQTDECPETAYVVTGWDMMVYVSTGVIAAR